MKYTKEKKSKEIHKGFGLDGLLCAKGNRIILTHSNEYIDAIIFLELCR